MKRHQKIITAALLTVTMIGTQFSINYSAKAVSSTSGKSSTTASNNLTEGNWVYTLSSTSSGQNNSAPGNGTPPSGTSSQSGNGTAPSGTPPQGGNGTVPSGMPSQGGNGTAPSGTPPQGGNGTAPSGMPPQGGNGTAPVNSSNSSNKNTTLKTKTATILWGNGSEKSGNVVMIPAVLGGYKVTVLGNGAQNISSNNKTSNNYVLIPDGITTLSNHMIYDYNNTNGWSIPSSIKTITDGAFLSCPGTFYGVAGSAAAKYASADSTRTFVTYTKDGSKTFTASSASKGYMQPNGTYRLPSGMLDGKHIASFSIVSKYKYKIKKLTIDGKVVKKAAGKNTYKFNYTFTKFLLK